jgi:hypothetical protein
MVTIKLLGVEHADSWIESSEFMEDMLKGTRHTMAAKTVVVFLPFAQILAIYHLKDSLWISRKLAECIPKLGNHGEYRRLSSAKFNSMPCIGNSWHGRRP